MRFIRLMFWLFIVLLIAFAVIKRNELVSYLEQFTHGNNAVRTTQTNNAVTEPELLQPDENTVKQQNKNTKPIPERRTPFVEKKVDKVNKAKPDSTLNQTKIHDSARQAVKNGDYQTALKNYQEILEANPKQADKWGELGDMFHQMGENKRAAQAYANAAIVFNKQGKTDLANKIMPYIERYSPELVEKIRNTR